jgi:hypothetical protein
MESTLQTVRGRTPVAQVFMTIFLRIPAGPPVSA